MKRWIRMAPVAIVLLVIAGFVWRLANPPDSTVPSQLVGRPIPDFALEAALPDKPGLVSSDLQTGTPRLVNLFASWCVPCIDEAPLLRELQRRGIAIDGIAIRDRSANIEQFLAEHGDPFERLGSDPRSQLQLALGSAGVPESFIVDGQGIIRFQHVGPISEGDIPDILRAMEDAR